VESRLKAAILDNGTECEHNYFTILLSNNRREIARSLVNCCFVYHRGTIFTKTGIKKTNSVSHVISRLKAAILDNGTECEHNYLLLKLVKV
jgi:hypothetical protein